MSLPRSLQAIGAWARHKEQPRGGDPDSEGFYQGVVTCGERGAIRGDPDTSIRLDANAYVEVADDLIFSRRRAAGLTVELMRPDVLDSAKADRTCIGSAKARRGSTNGVRYHSSFLIAPTDFGLHLNPEGGLGAEPTFRMRLVDANGCMWSPATLLEAKTIRKQASQSTRTVFCAAERTLTHSLARATPSTTSCLPTEAHPCVSGRVIEGFFQGRLTR